MNRDDIAKPTRRQPALELDKRWIVSARLASEVSPKTHSKVFTDFGASRRVF